MQEMEDSINAKVSAAQAKADEAKRLEDTAMDDESERELVAATQQARATLNRLRAHRDKVLTGGCTCMGALSAEA